MLTLVHETAWHKKVVWAAVFTFKRIISVPIDFLNINIFPGSSGKKIGWGKWRVNIKA